MKTLSLLGLSILAATTAAQQVGHQKPLAYPQLSVSECTNSGGCSSETKNIVIDSNWMWTHQVGSSTNCFTGNTWDANLCPDDVTCAANCAIEAGDLNEYSSTYGVTASGDSLSLGFVMAGQYGTNVGSRNYLMENGSKYKMFHLKNREFTFTVDVSNMPCGLNGALYFSAMVWKTHILSSSTSTACFVLFCPLLFSFSSHLNSICSLCSRKTVG